MSRQPTPRVKCPHCQGAGTVELTGVYAETLAILKRHSGHPPLNGAALAVIAGCEPTAMNNRLKALEKHGLAIGQRFGREIKWRLP